MPEYIGYQGRAKGVDWAGIADKAITGYNTIQKDRDEQRASLEKSADDLVAASKLYKPGQSNVFNEKILEGADRARTYTLDLKKELMAGRITPTEYKSRVGKMSGDWKVVGDFAKSYNDILAKNTEYLNDPKASALGAYLLEKQASVSDLSGKNFVVDQGGSIVLSDPNSGMVIDFMSMLNPENQTPQKLDVITEVEKFTKGLGETSKYVNGLWTTSPILKTDNEYQKAKANFTKSMLQNPRGAASILSDYVGGYDFYETEQQKKDIEAAGGKAIQLVQGTNGIATPKLTADQEKEARAVLDRLVDSRVDVKKEQPRPVEKTKSDGGSGSGDDVSINNRRDLVEQIYNDPNSNSQYVLNKPFKINNRDVKIVSARPIEMMDKNRNPLKGIELVASYDFVNPKNGKITTTTELITESGEAAKRVINDLLNASLIPSETISYEKAFFNNPGTKKSGAGARYN
jgi:hypothetical protein